MVGKIGCHLIRKNHKTASGFNVIYYRFSLCVVSKKSVLTGHNIMEQIMIPNSGSEQVGGIAAFVPELKEI